MQESDLYSSSLASVSSYATVSTDESDSTDAEESESDTVNSESNDGPVSSGAQAPPPFLYPVPHTIAEEVQAGPGGFATPRAPTFAAAHQSDANMQGPCYVPSPIRTTFARSSMQQGYSQRNYSRRTPMASQAGTPNEMNLGGDYFNLNARQMQKLSAMSQGGRAETGPDSVPLTPSAIAFRHSSTVGMPTMWMTSHSNAASTANTPTAATFGQRTPGTATHPSMYFAVPGHGLSSMQGSSRDSSPRLNRFHKMEQSPTAGGFRLDPSPAGPLWKRRMEYKHPSKTVYGFPTKDDELAEEQDRAEELANCQVTEANDAFLLQQRKGVTPLSSRRSSWQAMSPSVTSDGKEKLPPYFCTVHIEGYLPRKMELVAPGQPARDRGWESLYFVLHGTVLHVYKTDISLLYNKSVSAEVIWGLNKTTHVHTTPMNESLHDDELADGEEHDKRDTVAHTNATGLEALISKSLDVKSRTNSKLSTSGPSEHTHKVPASNQLEYDEQIKLVHNALNEHRIHSYSMERAQCGLAADYTKRQHVVRMKLAGEQFLIQARNNFHVVDWIEAIQASANVCMDLETRPMPSFITLPRRRRRRHGDEAVSLNQHMAHSHSRS
ncbi:hypothetical protein MCAP1_001843 [Malassezia caprae]|uniref:PH domain-containing protein n=1 Tax=Malassezia caprae TaxID=1381934 RepID=A0AAF0E773_9BASI|nr:hypothetical protein MCAP1_001843 [Malassezia caprae]